ncbi:MAG: hypothetical protein RL539_1315, partial [Pseudomonadota bacterium]
MSRYATAANSCRAGVLGVDFTSAPSLKKPIVVARAALDVAVPTSAAKRGRIETREAAVGLSLLAFECFSDWKSFESFLRSPWADGACSRPPVLIGGFDFPFGLPKELLRAWQWDHLNHREIALRFAKQDRHAWVSALKRFCEPRAPGHKFAHRACDGPAGSSPSMKWVNPPVVFMYREGFRRLIDADWHLPGFEPALEGSAWSMTGGVQPRPIALEAYPGHLARALIGQISYKSDSVPRDPRRLQQRARMLERLAASLPFLGPLGVGLREPMIEDGRGDAIDAWLCAIQAAWAAIKGPPDWGTPEDADPQEGWICSLDL